MVPDNDPAREERVAFHGVPSGLSDGTQQLRAREPERARCTGVAGDLLLDDGSVDVIRAEMESGLRVSQTVHGPAGLEVRNVVEEQTRCREHPEIELTTRPREV